MRWLGLVGVVAGGLVCCGAAAASAGIDLNWGLAIGLPAAAGLFGVVLRIWPSRNGSRNSNGYIKRPEYKEDINALHRRITDETVSAPVCEATRRAIEDRLERVEQKLDQVLVHVGPKRR